MKAVRVTCPQCGAALRVGDDASSITCEYCGNQARVQRRSRVLERVLPPPEGPRPIAVQQRSAMPAVIIVVVIATMAFVIYMVTHAVREGMRRAHRAASGAGGTTAPEERYGWEGTGGILLRDLDGNGVLDVIGRRRRFTPDEISIVGIDAATGKERWRSAVLGSYTDTYQGNLALAGDTVLFASARAELTAISAVDGATRWTVTMPERTASFCDAGGGVVIAIGTDEVRRPLKLSDGTTAPAPPAEAPCPVLPDDRGGGDPSVTRGDLDYEVARRLGLWSATTFRGPTGATVAVGQKAKGTHVAQMFGLDDAGRTARWTVDIPTDPLGAQETAPDQVTIGADQACATWDPVSGGNPHLTCFAVTDGARRWDVELGDDLPLEAVVLTPDLIFVSMWNWLEARDPATGALRWRYGDH